MKKASLSAISLYLLITSSVFCWWYLAFCSPNSADLAAKPEPENTTALNIPPPQYLSYLSQLDRNHLQKALSGDVKMMTALMADWDVDARILEKYGLHEARRLPREKFLRAQMIGRKLLNSDESELNHLHKEFSAKFVLDDNGNRFNLDGSIKKFLPQTYVSASFLLSLTEPENIVAIPQGFRFQKNLFSTSLTDKIPLDIDRYNSEKIYQSKPDIAFVSPFSHPSAMQALSNQGIPLFSINAINTLTEIPETIKKVGHVANRPLEAELLALFMESALLAIDNHLIAMSRSVMESQGSPRILFLNHLTQFSLPTKKTITGQLLERLQLNFVSLHQNDKDEWMIPVDHEQIVHCNPDCLIVASSQGEIMKNQLLSNPAFHSLSARKNDRIFFIDADPHAPTQYVVLAYYDIAQAVVKATSPYLRQFP